MNLKELDITTPEHVNLRFKIAGIGSRAAAQLIDWLILGLLNFTIFFITIKLDEYIFAAGSIFSNYLWGITIVIFFLLTWGYFALYEFLNNGRTFGKMLLGLRVIRDNGQSITFLSSIIRNLLRIVDFIPGFYFLGTVMIFAHPKHKRIGDLVAGTIVIYERRSKKKKKKDRYEKEMEKRGIDPSRVILEEWAKKKVGNREWTLLKTYIERRETLTNEDKDKLTIKVSDILLPLIGLERGIKSSEELEKDLLALYIALREEWEFEF
jgi:uncharacterized RDD family membrane protein YckC